MYFCCVLMTSAVSRGRYWLPVLHTCWSLQGIRGPWVSLFHIWLSCLPRDGARMPFMLCTSAPSGPLVWTACIPLSGTALSGAFCRCFAAALDSTGMKFVGLCPGAFMVARPGRASRLSNKHQHPCDPRRPLLVRSATQLSGGHTTDVQGEVTQAPWQGHLPQGQQQCITPP